MKIIVRLKSIRETMHSPEIKYSDLISVSTKKKILAFMLRMEAYYFKAIKILQRAGGQGFMEVAIGCIVIDCLTRYYYGKIGNTNRDDFKDLLKIIFPQFKNNIPSTKRKRLKKFKDFKNRSTKNYADAIYDAFRCGVLHEARIKAYANISGLNTVFEWDNERLSIDPGKFNKKIKKFFKIYILNLLNKKKPLIENFTMIINHFIKEETK